MPSSARSSRASLAASWPRSTAPPRSSPACACSDARPMASLPSSTYARPAGVRSSWSASACATPASRFVRSWASSRSGAQPSEPAGAGAGQPAGQRPRRAPAIDAAGQDDRASTSRGSNGHVLITVSRQRPGVSARSASASSSRSSHQSRPDRAPASACHCPLASSAKLAAPCRCWTAKGARPSRSTARGGSGLERCQASRSMSYQRMSVNSL